VLIGPAIRKISQEPNKKNNKEIFLTKNYEKKDGAVIIVVVAS
jgi:hypothetical protein